MQAFDEVSRWSAAVEGTFVVQLFGWSSKCSLGTRRLGGFRNSLLKAKVVKAEDFRIPERLVTFRAG